jgi:hypothetical protein
MEEGARLKAPDLIGKILTNIKIARLKTKILFIKHLLLYYYILKFEV